MSQKSSGIKIDLGEYNKASHGFLGDEKKESTRKSLNRKSNFSKGVESLDQEKKLGRPMIEEEPLSKKLIASVTKSEWDKIEKDRGLVSASAYLRMKMREAGII